MKNYRMGIMLGLVMICTTSIIGCSTTTTYIRPSGYTREDAVQTIKEVIMPEVSSWKSYNNVRNVRFSSDGFYYEYDVVKYFGNKKSVPSFEGIIFDNIDEICFEADPLVWAPSRYEVYCILKDESIKLIVPCEFGARYFTSYNAQRLVDAIKFLTPQLSRPDKRGQSRCKDHPARPKVWWRQLQVLPPK